MSDRWKMETISNGLEHTINFTPEIEKMTEFVGQKVAEISQILVQREEELIFRSMSTPMLQQLLTSVNNELLRRGIK